MSEPQTDKIAEALQDGKKPMLHQIVLTERVEGVNLARLSRFYVNSLYFAEESSKVRPRSRFTIEPRFALGQMWLVRELAPIAKAKIKRYGIKQLVAPGYGGVCGLMCFAATGEEFNWALARIEGQKQSRILTSLDGFIDKSLPVWITDDLIASGNAAIKTIKLLLSEGFQVAGFIPVVADITGNTGVRSFQTISASMRFKFDWLVGVARRSREDVIKLAKFSRRNKAIND
jgi:orotate phosphoribosyltransferase